MNLIPKEYGVDLSELERAIAAVPFGQSVFQNVRLADDATTPQRRMRYCLLQLDQKLKALKHNGFQRRRTDVDLRELRDRLKAAHGFDAERIAIDIEEKEDSLLQGQKLIDDCLVEIKTFYAMFRALPATTREQFEEAELDHWRGKFTRAAELEMSATGRLQAGTLEALSKVGIVVQVEGDQVKLLTEGNKNGKDDGGGVPG